MKLWLGWLLGISATACATEFTPATCAVDADCGDGAVCELRADQPVCVRPDDAPLVIGQSAPISGTNQALGMQMKLGIELAFAEQNALGGVRGRRLELAFRDDAYQPPLAEAAARALVDAQVSSHQPPRCPSTTSPGPGQSPVSTTALSRGPDAVLALLGSVGTPTMLRAAPVAVETGTLYFGAFTGASTLLRDMQTGPCARFIFNVRASHVQEAYATIELLRKRAVTSSHRNVISFDQDDSLGQASYDGLVAAYQDLVGRFPASADPVTPIARFRYTHDDDTSVPAQASAMQAYLAQRLTSQSGTVNVGVVVTGSDGAAVELIRAIRTWQYASDAQQQSLQKATRLRITFSNMSVVGADALAERLVAAGSIQTPAGAVALADGAVVSQVVPNYHRDASDVVSAYHRQLATRSEPPSFASLEGYITARVLVAGLLAHDGPFTPERLVRTFEQLPALPLGLGPTAGFAPNRHQYASSVWGTELQADGTFANLYFWSDGTPIQFFE